MIVGILRVKWVFETVSIISNAELDSVPHEMILAGYYAMLV